MPWEKKKEKSATSDDAVYSTVGAVACYKMKVTKTADGKVDSFTFTHLWSKPFSLQTGSLAWDEENSTLYIGFDHGKLVRIKVQENPMQWN